MEFEFEGDYLFDRKWLGIGYDKSGLKSYELINGNGNIKEYDDERYLIFEGELMDGKKLELIKIIIKIF